MNQTLTLEIIKHVFANLAIISSNFININKTKSLLNKDFLLPEKLVFEDENGEINKNIYGCQFEVSHQDMKILLGDCSQEVPEFSLLVKLKDSPIYGLYLSLDDLNPFIGVSLNGTDWMECNTYLQATFLAGMEQIKELGLGWVKCTDYQESYSALKNFIKYYGDFYARKEEGY